MPKIVVLDGFTANPGDLSWAEFEALGELRVYDRTTPEQTAARIADHDIVLTNKTVIDKAVLDACPHIRYIGVLATGYNVVDVQEAGRRSIPVCNVPEYSTAAVAQMTFALLLEICHHVGHHAREVARGEWEKRPDFCFWDYPLVELSGKTLGIVGYGRIGRAVARLANAFGMRVLARASRPFEPDGVSTSVSLDELLAQSDIVSLHCPLTPQTQGIINADSIGKMKPGAFLLNTSRGGLVVEEDIRQALTQGRLGYYAADVACTEPLSAKSPLLGAPNCLLTPHIAWAPKETRARLLTNAAQNIANYLRGTPSCVVNP